MNKIEALKAAQDLQRNKATNGEQVSVNIRDDEITLTGNGVCLAFPFSEPEPLVRNSIAMCFDGLVRYALGEILNGVHKFAKPGYTADTNPDNRYDGLKDGEFEIIETPTNIETMQTPDEICVHFKCNTYKHKSFYKTHEDYTQGNETVIESCQRCTISVSAPSGMKVE